MEIVERIYMKIGNPELLVSHAPSHVSLCKECNEFCLMCA